MDYYGIGFSNIRLPNDEKSYIYKYKTGVNQFPEEVFLHEFLHTLERNAKEYGYERPELHDYEKYGYKNEKLYGQEKWYKDYMNKNIETTSGKIGLPEEIYTLKYELNSTKSDIKNLKNDDSYNNNEELENLARNKLGMIKQNEIIYLEK